MFAATWIIIPLHPIARGMCQEADGGTGTTEVVPLHELRQQRDSLEIRLHGRLRPRHPHGCCDALDVDSDLWSTP